MTIWCIRIAYWILKATNTHSECVIHIVFPRQRWLRLRDLMLHSAYTICLSCILIKLWLLLGVRASQWKHLLLSVKTPTVTIIWTKTALRIYSPHALYFATALNCMCLLICNICCSILAWNLVCYVGGGTWVKLFEGTCLGLTVTIKDGTGWNCTMRRRRGMIFIPHQILPRWSNEANT